MVEHRFCKAVVASSSLVGGFAEKFFRQKTVKKVESKMTLLSKKDHDMIIKALDCYLFLKGSDLPKSEQHDYENLLDWIKIKSKESL